MVQDLAGGVKGSDLGQQGRGQGFAAGNEELAGQQLCAFGALQKGLKMGRHDFEDVEGVLLGVTGQALAVGSVFVAEQMEAAAGDEGGEDAGVAEIGGKGGDGGKVQALRKLAEFEALGNEVGVVDQIAVADGDAFGQAGGTGGVEDVDEVFGSGIEFGVGKRLLCPEGRIAIEDAERAGKVGKLGKELLFGNQHGSCGQLLSEAGLGVVRIEGDVGAASFEDGEQGDDEVGRTVEGEADDRIRANAERAKMVSQLVSALVEKLVAELLFGKAQGGAVGGTGGLGFEQGVETEFGVVGGSLVPIDKEALALGGRQER